MPFSTTQPAPCQCNACRANRGEPSPYSNTQGFMYICQASLYSQSPQVTQARPQLDANGFRQCDICRAQRGQGNYIPNQSPPVREWTADELCGRQLDSIVIDEQVVINQPGNTGPLTAQSLRFAADQMQRENVFTIPDNFYGSFITPYTEERFGPSFNKVKEKRVNGITIIKMDFNYKLQLK